MTRHNEEELFKKLDKLLDKEEDKLVRELIKKYKASLKAIFFQVSEVYRLYDSGEGISYNQLNQLRRFEPLLNEINKELEKLTGEKIDILHRGLFDIYKESFNETTGIAETVIGKSLGIMLNPELIETAINSEVAGLTMDERIERDEAEIKYQIKTALVQGLIMGASYREIAQELQKRLEVSATKAQRIAHTEAHRLRNEARQGAFKASEERGVTTEKTWISTLDKRTRHSHRRLDGQTVGVDETFKINGYEALHPGGFPVAKENVRCRCTMIARFKDDELTKRKFTNKDGQWETGDFQTYDQFENN